MSMTEQQLIQEAQSGSTKAFAKLFDQNYKKVLGYLLKRCEDMDLARDLTSETFYKALRAFSKYQIQENKPLVAWLFTIASNELNYYFRHQNKYIFDSIEKYPEIKQQPDEEYILLAEKGEKLKQALNCLDLDDQAVIHLKYFENKKISEISAILNSNRGTIKSRLSRARQKLATLLQ